MGIATGAEDWGLNDRNGMLIDIQGLQNCTLYTGRIQVLLVATLL